METQKICPDCQGIMVMTPGGGGLFWRCQRCGRKLPYVSGDLKDFGDRSER